MIPFISNLVLGKEVSSWHCKCNKILHSEIEAKEHQHKHALERLKELNTIKITK